MWITDSRVNDTLRKRWNNQLIEGLENFRIDPELIPCLRLINSVPGITTWMSCASHPESLPTKPNINDLRRAGQFYISMALTDIGFTKIFSIHDELWRMLLENDSVKHFKNDPKAVSLSFSKNPFGGPNHDHNYACYLTAHLDIYDPGVKLYFINTLHNVLMKFS